MGLSVLFITYSTFWLFPRAYALRINAITAVDSRRHLAAIKKIDGWEFR